MFEYRVGRTRAEVSALVDGGTRVIDKSYVEDPDTGTRLLSIGGLGPGENGGVYLLQWRGQTIGVECRVTRKHDENGAHPLFTLSRLGTSDRAAVRAPVSVVDLPSEEAAEAMLVAAEASVVYESHRADYGPGTRVSDPLGTGRELSPVDFDPGYGEIIRAPWGSR